MHIVVNHMLMLSMVKPLIIFGDALGRINIGMDGVMVVGECTPSVIAKGPLADLVRWLRCISQVLSSTFSGANIR